MKSCAVVDNNDNGLLAACDGTNLWIYSAINPTTIYANADIVPVDNIDLGSATNQFNNIYLSGSLNFGNTAVAPNFNSITDITLTAGGNPLTVTAGVIAVNTFGAITQVSGYVSFTNPYFGELISYSPVVIGGTFPNSNIGVPMTSFTLSNSADVAALNGFPLVAAITYRPQQ